MKAKGCLIALAVTLGLGFVVAAIVGPRLLRAGERIYRPIAKIQGAQKDFEAWEEQHSFKEPSRPELSAAKLDQFLALRKKFAAIDAANPLPQGRSRRVQSVDEFQGIMEGVGGNVVGRMAAYREAEMTSDEYRYLDHLIYALWLRPLRSNGQDPSSIARAIKEIEDAAAHESDAAVSRKLRSISAALRTKRIEVPPGIPPDLHALLFSRVGEIDALVDQGGPIDGRRR